MGTLRWPFKCQPSVDIALIRDVCCKLQVPIWLTSILKSFWVTSESLETKRTMLNTGQDNGKPGVTAKSLPDCRPLLYQKGCLQHCCIPLLSATGWNISTCSALLCPSLRVQGWPYGAMCSTQGLLLTLQSDRWAGCTIL